MKWKLWCSTSGESYNAAAMEEKYMETGKDEDWANCNVQHCLTFTLKFLRTLCTSAWQVNWAVLKIAETPPYSTFSRWGQRHPASAALGNTSKLSGGPVFIPAHTAVTAWIWSHAPYYACCSLLFHIWDSSLTKGSPCCLNVLCWRQQDPYT